MEKVRQRLLRAAKALDDAQVPYAIAGGNAVALWVSRVDESAVRNTQDVDVLIRREDLPAARAALEAAGHPTALWRAPSAEDRVAFVGEALGVWLWAVLWPPAAELVLIEHVLLHDLRHEAHTGLDLPLGAPSTRLGPAG